MEFYFGKNLKIFKNLVYKVYRVPLPQYLDFNENRSTHYI